MTSDRMMQAIGRIERAISRLEAGVDKLRERVRADSQQIARLNAERERQQQDLFAPPEPDGMDMFSREKALAALRSLDSLIDDLQRARRDG